MSGRGFVVRPITPPLWGISAPGWSPKLLQVCKSVPGMEWKGALRAGVGYVDAIEVAVAALRAFNLNVDDSALLAEVDVRPPHEHNLLVSYAESRDYQRLGIDFLVATGPSGALLADDMSCGKCHMSLRAARAFKRKTVILCPSHVRGVWERPPAPAKGDEHGGEVTRWWGDAAKAGIERLYGLKPRALNPEAMVAIVHYDIVHAWVDELLKWGVRTWIADEAHVLLNPTSRRSIACRVLARACSVRMALTGTPMPGRPRDMWNLLDTLSESRFGDFFPYGKRYCGANRVEIAIAGGATKNVWDFNGRSNEEELSRRLSWMMLRRTKREVAKEMPPKTRQVIDVEVRPNARMSTVAFSASIKHTAAMRRALDISADSKLPAAINLTRSHLEDGHKIIVFTWRREIAERIARECAGDGQTNFIHGGVSAANRSKRIHALKTHVGAGLLACTIDSCSTGIDLSFADNAFFAELTWKPLDLLQAEDRVHRIGRGTPTLIQYMIGRGTADELVLAGVISKLDTFEAVVGSVGDGMKKALEGEKEKEEVGLSRLAAALRAMTEPEAPKARRKKAV